MEEVARPTTPWTIRDFPIELKNRIELLKVEYNHSHPLTPITFSGVVTEAIEFWLEHDGPKKLSQKR